MKKFITQLRTFSFSFIVLFFVLTASAQQACDVGGINTGNLLGYHMVFTDGSVDANWQSASKGFVGNVAVNGNLASLRTSGSFAYAGVITSNSSTLGAWQSIIDNNSTQSSSNLSQASTLLNLSNNLTSVFSQINALTVSAGYNGVAPTSLNGLNTQNGVSQRFVININSDFGVSSKINITGDAGDIFILRWDTDMNFANGYQGQVKFQSGGGIVPFGGLKVSNFLHVAGNIGSSGGGSNPAAPYPQGPRLNNGTGSLITNGSDFNGGGFFTGYWFTTGDPSDRQTASLSNAIFVGGWYSSTTKFSMTSGTSGVYVAPVCTPTYNLGDFVWSDTNNNGVQDAGEPGIAGATVNLYLDANADNIPDGAVVATTTTSSTGFYSFNNINTGKYVVAVVIPNGYAQGTTTATSADPNNANNTDNNGVALYNTTSVRSNSINLIADNPRVDFGFKGTATIGDFVWNDLNGNGIQDAGEPGLADVLVTLKDAANNVVGTFTTTSTGAYSFPNLAAGTYTVTFTTPTNFQASPATQGADVTKDSNPVGGVASVTLTAGQTNNTVDAGFVSTQLNLGDFVWYDVNNNGVNDAGEPGIAGATVNLYADANGDNVPDGAAIATTTTSPTGIYAFTGLTPGNYIVGVTLPAGYAQGTTTATSASPNNDNLTDNNGVTVVGTEVRSNFITLTTNGEPTTDGDGNNGNLSLDFGLRGTGSIGNFVFTDINANGIQDAGEVGLSGVVVTLKDAAGAVVATTTSDASGLYSFTNLAPGTYSVTFGTPANFVASPANQGADDNVDSDPVNGVVSVNLVAGENNSTIDAGFISTINLFGNVWHDANGLADNQVNSTSTTPIPSGIRAYLVDNRTGLTIARTNVLPNGTFSLLNVPANSPYRVVISTVLIATGVAAPPVILPSGWSNTGEKLGAFSGSDGSPDGRLTVPTQAVDVFNINFGIRLRNGDVVIG